jgi:hypothetical protein
VRADDSVSVDAFGRWRVSNPTTIFDSKQIFDNLPLFWDEELESGAGITSAWSKDTASTVITSTANTAGVFTRQTFMRFNYQPGKSQLIMMSGILAKSGGGAGAQCRFGVFDDENGMFFAGIFNVPNVVRRTNVSGTPVDNEVPQSSWNVDKMDGTGPSGVTVDFSKVQTFCTDYQWSSGRVRMCLVIDGTGLVVHEFLSANTLDAAFMSTPNLPLRIQMVTTSDSPESSMETIDSTVISEGGTNQLGSLRYVSTGGTHLVATTENIIYAVLGFRLKSTHLGATILMAGISIAEHVGGKEYEWMLIANPLVASTFTYVGETNSAVEVAVGVAANTVTGGTQIGGGYGSSAQKGGAQTAEEISSAVRLGAAIDGTQTTTVLCVRPVGGTSGLNIEAGVVCRELS